METSEELFGGSKDKIQPHVPKRRKDREGRGLSCFCYLRGPFPFWGDLSVCVWSWRGLHSAGLSERVEGHERGRCEGTRTTSSTEKVDGRRNGALVRKRKWNNGWWGRGKVWDVPGGPEVESPRFHCRERGFDPWLGN